MDSVKTIRPLPARDALAVTLHVPSGDGRFTEIRKFRTRTGDHVTTPDKGEIFVERSEQADFLTRATVQGDVVYRRPLEGKGPVRLIAGATRTYASSSHHIVAFDPDSGAPTGRLDFSAPRSLSD